MNKPYSSGMKFAGVQWGGAEGYYSEEELAYLNTFNKAGTAEMNCELFTKEESWLDNVNTLTKTNGILSQALEVYGWYRNTYDRQ